MIEVELDGDTEEFNSDKTILENCRKQGKEIPTFCEMRGHEPESRCRVCLVEKDGTLVTSCSTYPEEGCTINTSTERVEKARERNKDLMRQSKDDSEAYNLFKETGIGNNRFEKEEYVVETLGQALARDRDSCVNCGNCVEICDQIQGVHAIDFAGRGHESHITPYGEKRLSEVACIRCGQCLLNCDEDAIFEREHIDKVKEAINDEDETVVAQTAPAVRASLGEVFDIDAGTDVEGRMVSALRKLGFDRVFDTVFGADLTIVEEASELLQRLEDGGPFPLITSCCPSWIMMMEHFYPELRENVSTCKSPHEMVGSLTKSYFAENEDLDGEDITVVSVMPCISKKFESSRSEIEDDVDFVITTRELGRMIKEDSISFDELEKGEFDDPLGISTGAGKIFGVTGGVMEAALRTAAEKLGEDINLDIKETRGEEGIKKGEITLNGKSIKFAVAHGGSNIDEVVSDIENGEEIHFVEFMACPGGCIGGGGQPKSDDPEILEKRSSALYRSDKESGVRLSHENPAVKKVYEDYLDHPLSDMSEELLHTFFVKRDSF